MNFINKYSNCTNAIDLDIFLNGRVQILPLGEMNLPDDWIMPDHY